MKLQRHRWGDLHDSPPQKGLNAQPAWESREPGDATGNWSQFLWSQWKVSFPLWNSREEALCEYSPQSELASTGDVMNSRVNCGTPVPTGAQWIKGFLSQALVHFSCPFMMHCPYERLWRPHLYKRVGLISRPDSIHFAAYDSHQHWDNYSDRGNSNFH